MKVYFIQSTPYAAEGQLIKKSKLYFVGLAPAILSALLPDDIAFEACLETIEDVDFSTDADLIAISGMGHAMVRSIDLARRFNRNKVKSHSIFNVSCCFLANLMRFCNVVGRASRTRFERRSI